MVAFFFANTSKSFAIAFTQCYNATVDLGSIGLMGSMLGIAPLIIALVAAGVLGIGGVAVATSKTAQATVKGLLNSVIENISGTIQYALDWLWGFVSGMLLSIWSVLAYVVDLLEQAFRMLAGIDPIKGFQKGEGSSDPGIIGNEMGDPKDMDIVSSIINTPTVQTIFVNLMIIAIILMLFFTVLQIIREQYNNPAAANPYKIVFRLFKGMISFLFITSAVLVGLTVSKYVLTALEQATGKNQDDSISGMVFHTMAANASYARMEKPTGNEFTDTAKMVRWSMIPHEESGKWYYGEKAGGAGYDISSQSISISNEYGFFPRLKGNDPGIQWYMYTFTYDDPWKYGYTDYAYSYMMDSTMTVEVEPQAEYIYWNQDLYDKNYLYDYTEYWAGTFFKGGSPTFSYTKPEKTDENKGYYTEEEILKEFEASTRSPGSVVGLDQTFKDLSIFKEWKELIYEINYFGAAIFDFNNKMANTVIWKDEFVENEFFRYPQYSTVGAYSGTTGEPTNGSSEDSSSKEFVKSFSVVLPTMPGTYNWFSQENPDEDSDELLKKFIESDNNDELADVIGTKQDISKMKFEKYYKDKDNSTYIWKADNIDALMKKKPFTTLPSGASSGTTQKYYYLYKITSAAGVSFAKSRQAMEQYANDDGLIVEYCVGGAPMSYQNAAAVKALYEVRQINYFIGFFGMFIVAGVFINFAIAMIQRLLELVVMYIMSPMTLATYPVDDGSSFKNNFVLPFYKKVISVYSIVLTLNLFFLIYPLFTAIKFFDDGSATNNASTVDQQYYNWNKAYNLAMQLFMSVALIGLMPKMRSTINSMLGAENIEGNAKGLGGVWGDFSKAVGFDPAKAAMKGVGAARWAAGKGYGAAKWVTSKGMDLGRNAEYWSKANKAARDKNYSEKAAAWAKENGKDPKDYANTKEGAKLKKYNDMMDKRDKSYFTPSGLARTFYKGTLATGNAAAYMAQPLLNSAIGKSLFDMKKGSMMQGDFGNFARKFWDRGEDKKYKADMNKSLEERAAVDGADRGQVMKAAQQGTGHYNGALKAAGILGYGETDAKGLAGISSGRIDKDVEKARSAQIATLEKGALKDALAGMGGTQRQAAMDALRSGQGLDTAFAGTGIDISKLKGALDGDEGAIEGLLNSMSGAARASAMGKITGKRPDVKDTISRLGDDVGADKVEQRIRAGDVAGMDKLGATATMNRFAKSDKNASVLLSDAAGKEALGRAAATGQFGKQEEQEIARILARSSFESGSAKLMDSIGGGGSAVDARNVALLNQAMSSSDAGSREDILRQMNLSHLGGDYEQEVALSSAKKGMDAAWKGGEKGAERVKSNMEAAHTSANGDIAFVKKAMTSVNKRVDADTSADKKSLTLNAEKIQAGADLKDSQQGLKKSISNFGAHGYGEDKVDELFQSMSMAEGGELYMRAINTIDNADGDLNVDGFRHVSQQELEAMKDDPAAKEKLKMQIKGTFENKRDKNISGINAKKFADRSAQVSHGNRMTAAGSGGGTTAAMNILSSLNDQVSEIITTSALDGAFESELAEKLRAIVSQGGTAYQDSDNRDVIEEAIGELRKHQEQCESSNNTTAAQDYASHIAILNNVVNLGKEVELAGEGGQGSTST